MLEKLSIVSLKCLVKALYATECMQQTTAYHLTWCTGQTFPQTLILHANVDKTTCACAIVMGYIILSCCAGGVLVSAVLHVRNFPPSSLRLQGIKNPIVLVIFHPSVAFTH